MSAYAWPGIEFSAYRTGNGGTIARAAETHEPPTCGKCGAENCSLIAERPAQLTTRERVEYRNDAIRLFHKGNMTLSLWLPVGNSYTGEQITVKEVKS